MLYVTKILSAVAVGGSVKREIREIFSLTTTCVSVSANMLFLK